MWKSINVETIYVAIIIIGVLGIYIVAFLDRIFRNIYIQKISEIILFISIGLIYIGIIIWVFLEVCNVISGKVKLDTKKDVYVLLIFVVLGISTALISIVGNFIYNALSSFAHSNWSPSQKIKRKNNWPYLFFISIMVASICAFIDYLNKLANGFISVSSPQSGKGIVFVFCLYILPAVLCFKIIKKEIYKTIEIVENIIIFKNRFTDKRFSLNRIIEIKFINKRFFFLFFKIPAIKVKYAHTGRRGTDETINLFGFSSLEIESVVEYIRQEYVKHAEQDKQNSLKGQKF